jgi:CheY-like chemotaxis protein
MESKVIEVLLVEDDLDSVYLTVTAAEMGKTAFHVNLAFDGVEAMDYLYRRGKYTAVPRPDLILLDLNMPRMNGQEVLHEIKKDPNLSTIPVVILTTSDQHPDLKTTYGLSEDSYHIKPSRFNDYIDLMKFVAEAYKKGRLNYAH